MEWLKRRLRGTALHAWSRRLRGRAPDPPGALANLNAEYDRQTVEVMRRVLREDGCAVDIGAHRGDVLRHMLALAPRGRHHAFEPLPHLAAHLRATFPGATVHEAAVSDAPGEAEFVHVANDPGYSGLRERLYDRPDPRLERIRVAVTTLDAALPADARVAFIKLDIEGGEFHALNGGVETIRRGRPVIVFEAGPRSTGQYGVTAEAMYDLLSVTLGHDVSTMRHWLAGGPPFTREAFATNWRLGPDFYFIATPRA